jgi:hypothetical protein
VFQNSGMANLVSGFLSDAQNITGVPGNTGLVSGTTAIMKNAETFARQYMHNITNGGNFSYT